MRLALLLCTCVSTFGQAVTGPHLPLMNQASGTSVNPLAGPTPMVMNQLGSWSTSFMGQAFLVDTQQ